MFDESEFCFMCGEETLFWADVGLCDMCYEMMQEEQEEEDA